MKIKSWNVIGCSKNENVWFIEKSLVCIKSVRKMWTYTNRGRGRIISMQMFAYNFSIKYLVHKLHTIIARFSFIKIYVLLKTSIWKKNFFFFVWFMIKPDNWSVFKKKYAFTGIDIWYALIFVRWYLWQHRYHPLVKILYFLFHAFLHVADVPSICLNRQILIMNRLQVLSKENVK